MLLPDWLLRQEVRSGRLFVSLPADEDPLDRLQPASLDVTLSGSFWLPEEDDPYPVDPCLPEEEGTAVEVEPGGCFELPPGGFALASTREWFGVPHDLALKLEGRSSLGRRGLLIHATAGFVDPGFCGTVTLELANLRRRPFRLWPGMAIGQLLAYRLEAPVERPYGSPSYGSRYQGQSGPTPSRSDLDWTRSYRTR